MPGARVRAMLFGKNFQPGTPTNTALRLLYQFKIWPADMVTRAWEREIYGTIGDGGYDRAAGLVEAAVGAIVFGVASEAVQDAIQGKDPIAKLEQHPIAAMVEGAQRSGFGSLVGDFLLGQFDRHGFSAVASLAGPTYAQIDTLMGILHGAGDSDRRAARRRRRTQRTAPLAQPRDRRDEARPRQYAIHEPVADKLGYQRADLASAAGMDQPRLFAAR